jgi:hypothetical protein
MNGDAITEMAVQPRKKRATTDIGDTFMHPNPDI